LLIVFGRIGRRGGAFSAFTPEFEEVEGGWDLKIRQLALKVSPGCLEQISWERLPVTISGHALERMFQRTNSIEWPVIRDCLASATLLLNAAIPAYIAAQDVNSAPYPPRKGSSSARSSSTNWRSGRSSPN